MNIKYVLLIIIKFLLKDITAQNETTAATPAPEPGSDNCIDEMDNDACEK